MDELKFIYLKNPKNKLIFFDNPERRFFMYTKYVLKGKEKIIKRKRFYNNQEVITKDYSYCIDYVRIKCKTIN